MKSLVIIFAALMLSLALVDACTIDTKADKDKCELIPCQNDKECEKGHCRVLMVPIGTKQCMLRAKEGMTCLYDDDCDTGICSKGTGLDKCLPRSYLVPILIAVIIALLVVILSLAFIRKRN